MDSLLSRPREDEALPQCDWECRQILDATSDAISIHDENGRILDVNERMCALLACSRDAAISLYPWDLVLGDPQHSEEEARECIRRVWTEGPQVFEWPCRRFNGESFWAEITVRAYERAGCRRLIASVRDITHRKRLEDALRQKGAEASAKSVPAAPAGVGLLVNRVFRRVNASLCKITGYGEEELVGQETRILYPSEEEYARVADEGYGRLQYECLVTTETRICRKDGSLINVLLHLIPFDPSNPVAGVTCTVVDITERKRAEASLNAHVEEIERFNRLATARELHMLELKRRVNELSKEAGRPEPYPYAVEEPLPETPQPSPASSSGSSAGPGLQGEFRLADLLDREQLQQVLDNFCDVVGVSAAIFDPQGQVFVEARWRRICAEFHRGHEATRTRCLQSNMALAAELRQGEQFSLHRCGNGLAEAAAPIVVEGRHVGSVFIGQFFLEPPDVAFFRRQAAECGFEETAYLAALARVPVLAKERLPAILRYATSAAQMGARMGLQRIRSRAIEVDLQRKDREKDQIVQQLREQRKAAINLAQDAFEARDAAESARRSFRDSEERLGGITSAALDAIVMIDDRGRISFWNQAAERMFGYAREDALGRDLHEWLAPAKYRQASRAGMAHFAETGHGPALGRMLELTGLRANGEEFPIELSVSSIRLHGKPHAVGIIRDITDRKLAENQFRSTQQQLRDIVEFLPDATFVIDQQKRVVAWNRAIEQITGVRKEDILGKDTYSLCFYDERRPILIDMVLETDERLQQLYTAHGIKNGEVYGESFVQKAWDGKGAYCWGIASRLFDSQGNTIGAIESIRDVTDRKRAEDALQHAKEAAEGASRAKSAFLANMSHEIRTPMTSILGYTDMLVEECRDPKALEHLLVVKRNGEHLLQVINDILNLSAIESGKLNTETEVCSALEQIAGVVEMMRERAQAKGVALSVDCPAGPAARIRTDPCRFRQILVNLIGNALKFAEHGSVRVVVRRSDDGSRWFCDVCDTGIGIAAEQVANLFQPFSQLDTSPSRRFGGTGLGLAISKSLAEHMGGELLLVASQVGQGSRFRLALPLVSPDHEPGAEEPPPRSAGSDPSGTPSPPALPPALPLSGRHVLLAEDGLDNQRLIALILRKAGATVSVVENGQLAVDAVRASCEKGPPLDVVLMDMQMPVLDGYQAVEQLRRAGYTGRIVALTAHAMANDRRRCLDVGCDEYLTKPVDRQSLVAAITCPASAGTA